MSSEPLDFRLVENSVTVGAEPVPAQQHRHGCDQCATGGYHGNGLRDSENYTSLLLRKMAALQWQSALVPASNRRGVEEPRWKAPERREEQKGQEIQWAHREQATDGSQRHRPPAGNEMYCRSGHTSFALLPGVSVAGGLHSGSNSSVPHH